MKDKHFMGSRLIVDTIVFTTTTIVTAIAVITSSPYHIMTVTATTISLLSFQHQYPHPHQPHFQGGCLGKSCPRLLWATPVWDVGEERAQRLKLAQDGL